MKLISFFDSSKEQLTTEKEIKTLPAITSKILSSFVKTPYTAQEVKLLRDKILSLTEYAYATKHTVRQYEFIELRAQINGLFKGVDYTATYGDSILKGLHKMYVGIDSSNYDFDEKELNIKELRETIEFVTKLYNKLCGDEFKIVIMDRILKFFIDKSVDNIENVKKAESEFSECIRIAKLLGWITPGDDSYNAFIAQCKTLRGVGKSNGYENEIEITDRDLKYTEEFLRGSNYGKS
jgi:hypothetical protein